MAAKYASAECIDTTKVFSDFSRRCASIIQPAEDSDGVGEPRMFRVKSCLMLATASVVSMVPAMAQSPTTGEAPALESEFSSPPQSARPRVWWHWMNGNISKDGIAKDLAWMKRVGIGGAQTFDANITTPQILKNRLAYMSPEWKDAFRFAASEAERLGIELAIASSPGWTETGGPWVAPADGMKKLTWSETLVTGGRRFRGRLEAPAATTGPFQGLKGDPLHGLPLNGGEMPALPPPFYVDQFVLAVPEGRAEIAETPEIRDSEGKILPVAAVTDADLESSLEVPRSTRGAPVLTFHYKSPQTVRSASLFMPGAGALHFNGSVAPKLEYSSDGQAWRLVADILPKLVPTTVSFAPVTARHFRLVFNPPKSAGFTLAPPPAGVDFSAAGNMAAAMAPKPLRIGYFRLSSRDRIDHVEAKAGFSIVADYGQIMPVLPHSKGAPLSHVIDLTDSLRPDGTLDWQAPPGRWRVLRLGYSLIGTMNHPASFEATGLEVDKLDGAAVTRYLEHYLGSYRDTVGADLLGNHGVRAVLNDSIEVGPSNWTPRIVEHFRRLRGYDPRSWLPALTGIIVSSRSESDRFLYDYRRTLSDLMASEHYGTVSRVAHQYGLIAYSEALEADRSSLGDDMAMRRFADVPMAANWFFE